MKRKGVCQKCGKETTVRDHHLYGYDKEHKDEVAPYCASCDQKAHNKARREGRCILSGKETTRYSTNSYKRRSLKRKILSRSTLMPDVQLLEHLYINMNTGTIVIGTGFTANNRRKIKYIGDQF